MLDFQQAAKRAAKAATASIVSRLCNELDKVQKSNKGVVPYAIIINLIYSSNTTSPILVITRHDIWYILVKYTREMDTDPTTASVASVCD